MEKVSRLSNSSSPAAWAASRAALVGLVLVAAGCSSYYRVTDPAGSKTYYTKDIDRDRDGTIQFEDSRTRSKVTMQSSEVTKIDKKEFEEAVKPK